MSPRPVLSESPTGEAGFGAFLAQMAAAPLHELGAADPGAEPAAIGFSLNLATALAGKAGIIWAGEEGVFAEEGAPYPPGLAQLGLDPGRLIVVRTAKREDCLWAAEQALSLRGAVVVCALTARGKPLDLKVTRRLLLFAERGGSKCLLVRPRAEASAAWTRWRIAPAVSQAEPRELGPPAYALELVRNRAGPTGARFIVEWHAPERVFTERRLENTSKALRRHA